MDIPRQSTAGRRRTRSVLIAFGGIAAIALITIGLSRLEPSVPSIDRATVWVDTVKRGSMLRRVRGSGTLVPEEIRWIPALTEGRVERIRTLPGTEVEADTIILDLSNSELEVSKLEAASELKAAEAELVNLRVQLQSRFLTQRSETALIEAERRQASLQVDADRELSEAGLIADITLKISEVRAGELETRAGIERQRLEISSQAAEAQLTVQRARVDRLRAAWQLRRDQVENLKVRAGVAGVLQQVPVQVGQQVTPGTNLARVAEPRRLKAEVRIAETQARDIIIGQLASIDTRNGVIAGRVSRIDPAVQNGTVTVDVALTGDLPRGARPDLSIDGTIELERRRHRSMPTSAGRWRCICCNERIASAKGPPGRRLPGPR